MTKPQHSLKFFYNGCNATSIIMKNVYKIVFCQRTSSQILLRTLLSAWMPHLAEMHSFQTVLVGGANSSLCSDWNSNLWQSTKLSVRNCQRKNLGVEGLVAKQTNKKTKTEQKLISPGHCRLLSFEWIYTPLRFGFLSYLLRSQLKLLPVFTKVW